LAGLIVYSEGATMTLPIWLQISILLVMLGFIVFCFRQGEKVKPNPKGAPPEETFPF
jgi:hypothetical protein